MHRIGRAGPRLAYTLYTWTRLSLAHLHSFSVVIFFFFLIFYFEHHPSRPAWLRQIDDWQAAGPTLESAICRFGSCDRAEIGMRHS